MKYRVHYGKAGQYGELQSTRWETLDKRPIASTCEGVGTTTVSVTLYNRAGKGFYRSGFTKEQAEAIVAAYLIERGFTEHVESQDTTDVRAYNE